ncbi:hypothetical protein SMICM304S_05188 [Streptomyces microflavus]
MTTTAAATAAGLDPATLGDLLRVAGSPGFDRLTEQLRRTGGCSQPIHLTGATKTIDRATGTLLHHYSTDTEPGGRLRIACGNRRASRCPACAWTYAGDTYHLIRAGLTGDPDKGTPTTIRDHPGLRHPDGPLVRSGPQPARQPHLPLTTGRRAPGDTKSAASRRFLVLPAFMATDLERHLDWYAEKKPDGLLFVGERGKPFRRSTFGRKWRKARAKVGLPENFRFYDLRHTGHTLSTRSGATLKDTMVRAGQSTERAALIYQHSDTERQKEVADGIDAHVRAARLRAQEEQAQQRSGTERARDT